MIAVGVATKSSRLLSPSTLTLDEKFVKSTSNPATLTFGSISSLLPILNDTTRRKDTLTPPPALSPRRVNTRPASGQIGIATINRGGLISPIRFLLQADPRSDLVKPIARQRDLSNMVIGQRRITVTASLRLRPSGVSVYSTVTGAVG